jgi:geranylgeranyl diphosphate synthase, type II
LSLFERIGVSESIIQVESDFKTDLSQKAGRISALLLELVDRQMGVVPRLKEALRYTLESPGKRIRAAVVLWACQAVCGEVRAEAETAAAAVEMVHTYSLVHDDLPAMDDDDLRRGRPTCHKAFDEATAILTGDALLTLAFEVLARDIPDPQMAVRLIRTLAEAAGPSGMITGQMADMQAENTPGTVPILQHIHLNKTAQMFAASSAMGAITGGAGETQLGQLIQYGFKIGLGFQVADDILDVSSTAEELGKTIGKDHKQGKVTYPAVVGVDESRKILVQLTEQALQALSSFDSRADRLRELAQELATRKN